MLNVWVACPPNAYSASLELHSLDLLKQLNILHSSAEGLEVNFPVSCGAWESQAAAYFCCGVCLAMLAQDSKFTFQVHIFLSPSLAQSPYPAWLSCWSLLIQAPECLDGWLTLAHVQACRSLGRCFGWEGISSR